MFADGWNWSVRERGVKDSLEGFWLEPLEAEMPLIRLGRAWWCGFGGEIRDQVLVGWNVRYPLDFQMGMLSQQKSRDEPGYLRSQAVV